MSYYFSCNHFIIDKFEHSTGVLNVDILDYAPKEKFDLIISIPTIEHVGYDDSVWNERNPENAIKYIKDNLIAKEGLGVITIPYGYNPYLDSCIKNGRLKEYDICYFKNISNLNWKQCSFNEITDSKYDEKYHNAEALAVIIISNKKQTI
ncbi:MAG: hypothetical protein JW864_02095 [Spirochaetes bacterium]|nr:hypothetical protein [Spirochaetota bacterium]